MSKQAELGGEIAALRKSFGLTQEELALESEISTQYMGRIEHGRANPTIKILNKIAAVLGKEVDVYFVDREDEK